MSEERPVDTSEKDVQDINHQPVSKKFTLPVSRRIFTKRGDSNS
jgi:hypothetical protein